MFCVVLQKAVLHSGSRAIFPGVLWHIVNVVGAVSEGSSWNTTDAADVVWLLVSPVSMATVLCWQREELPPLHWCLKFLTWSDHPSQGEAETRAFSCWHCCRACWPISANCAGVCGVVLEQLSGVTAFCHLPSLDWVWTMLYSFCSFLF